MNWLRGDTYYLQSGCKNYTICRISRGGTPVYELWRGRMHVSSHADADLAKRAAEAHAAKWAAGAPAA